MTFDRVKNQFETFSLAAVCPYEYIVPAIEPPRGRPPGFVSIHANFEFTSETATFQPHNVRRDKNKKVNQTKEVEIGIRILKILTLKSITNFISEVDLIFPKYRVYRRINSFLIRSSLSF